MDHETEERTTLQLLEALGSDLTRLRQQVRQLTTDLAKARRKVASLEKRKKAKAGPPPVSETKPTKIPAAPKRRALGRSLADIRGGTPR